MADENAGGLNVGDRFLISVPMLRSLIDEFGSSDRFVLELVLARPNPSRPGVKDLILRRVFVE